MSRRLGNGQRDGNLHTHSGQPYHEIGSPEPHNPHPVSRKHKAGDSGKGLTTEGVALHIQHTQEVIDEGDSQAQALTNTYETAKCCKCNETLEVDTNGDPLPDQEYEEERMTEEEKEAFLYELEEFDGQWSRIEIAPMVDLAVNIMDFGIGLAVYSQTEIGIKADKGIYDPRVWGVGTTNLVYVLGFAKPMSILTPGLTVGVNLKYVQRSQASLFTISASDLGNAEETLDPVQDELKEDVRSTFMIDVGALYDIPAIGAEVGGTIKGLGDGRGSSLDFGIAKRMWSNRLILLADYIDFLDNNKENVFSKINLGAQYKLAIFALRAGLKGGYPSLGFGLNFNVFDLDTAYYTKELTKGPGGYGEDRYVVQLKFGW